MIRQIRYFQAVVQCNSFSEAAEQCHISQSAISQQIQALEREIGFLLLERKNRKFTLTPAGEHFYRKSRVLIADYDRMCQESRRLANKEQAVLSIGFLRGYSGPEFSLALARFSEKYSDVEMNLKPGNHEELFEWLQNEQVDLALSDQRRAFSDAYENRILTTRNEYIEISSQDPLSKLETLTVNDLKNLPCILVVSKGQQKIEQAYYRDIIGFQGDFLFAENLEEARLMVVGKKGFMPVIGAERFENFGISIKRISLYRHDEPMTRNYCAFWKKDNSGYYVEEFADLLQSQFEHKIKS